MRGTSTTFIALVAAAALGVACEDGPSQTFSAAPANAGTIWNGTPGGGGIPADSGIFVGPATQGFDASVGGGNADNLCTASQQKTVWTANFNAPIIPPGLAGGLDIAGGYKGQNGIIGYDPACTSYANCSATPAVNPKYEPTTLPAPYWSAPTYDPARETWTGMTVEQAEQLLCQPANANAIFGGGYYQENWGEQGEFGVLYNFNSREITDFILAQGYNGLLEGTNSTTKTTYTVSMQNVFMTKTVAGGSPQDIVLNWTDGSLPGITNELYEAFRQTFLPDFPADQDCVAAGHCIIDNNGIDDGILFFTPLNLAIFVETTLGTPAANSIPFLIDLGLLKVLPFSGASVTMKLDPAGQGPTAITTGLGASADGGPGDVTCTYELGMKYGSPTTPGTFEHDCVQPFPNTGTGATSNAISQAKLLGALAHGDENYQFDINGVDPQFTASLTPTTVIADGQDPGPNDIAYQLTIDQFVLGPIANDYTNNDTTQAKDWHGIGLVTLEWANLVQQYMTLNYGVNTQLGDPDCIANPVRPALPDSGVYPPGTKICSGLEGIVTTAPPSLAPPSMAPNALGPAGLSVDNGGTNPNCNAAAIQGGTCAGNQISVGLKPGTWYSLFCSDAGGLDGTGTPIGYTKCIGGTANTANSYQGYYFDTMQEAVAISYGHIPGSPGGQTIPETLASRRFFFQQWILAVIKYLESGGTPNASLTTIDANAVDPNQLFFDTFGGTGSGFEFGEYVDRLTVNSGNQAPTALQVSVNLTTSVINEYTFDRYNFRGENALYTALSDKTTDKPGAEALYVTNIVGSPVLQYVFGKGASAYACATNEDPSACGGYLAPVDGFGNPLYAPYADAFGSVIPATTDGGTATNGTTIFNIPGYGATTENQPSGITIDSADYELIQSAMVTLPIIQPPTAYVGAVPTGAKSISALLPFLQGATVGFPVTIDGSRDKFYNTLNVDFTGTTVNGNLDYEYVPAGSTNLVVRAFETQNYLGAVFPCYEPNPTTGAPDILSVPMYANGADILTWITDHTFGSANPANDCGIQIKFSIYGNFADYITFGVNPGLPVGGVRLGLNAGFGGSVVSDVTIFDPNIVASLDSERRIRSAFNENLQL